MAFKCFFLECKPFFLSTYDVRGVGGMVPILGNFRITCASKVDGVLHEGFRRSVGKAGNVKGSFVTQRFLFSKATFLHRHIFLAGICSLDK